MFRTPRLAKMYCTHCRPFQLTKAAHTRSNRSSLPLAIEALKKYNCRSFAFYVHCVWGTDDCLLSKHVPTQSTVAPRFELGWLDSDSKVLTITPWNHTVCRHNVRTMYSFMWELFLMKRPWYSVSKECSLTGNRTRAAAVRAPNPSH